jgi:hypothetical protein
MVGVPVTLDGWNSPLLKCLKVMGGQLTNMRDRRPYGRSAWPGHGTPHCRVLVYHKTAVMSTPFLPVVNNPKVTILSREGMGVRIHTKCWEILAGWLRAGVWAPGAASTDGQRLEPMLWPRGYDAGQRPKSSLTVGGSRKRDLIVQCNIC